MTDKRVSDMTESELVKAVAAGVRAGIVAAMTFGVNDADTIRKAAVAELERRKSGEA